MRSLLASPPPNSIVQGDSMMRSLLFFTVLASSSLYGCATNEPISTTPPEPTFAPPSRWESEYRTGSRLPVPNKRASSTVQPVYQFDAVEWGRERPGPCDPRGQ